MSDAPLRPKLVFADERGDIYDHPELEMLTRRGGQITTPRPDELIPLPPESEFFLLPGRDALGLDPETGQVERLEDLAVAAFVCPGYALSGTAAYAKRPGAPTLPLFAYGAVGFANDRFYVCARKVDDDPRQRFSKIKPQAVARGAQRLLAAYPENRLLRHLSGCALTFCCPAARNLALGRYEAPLPTSRTCNARCLGCLSQQPADSGFPATQNRIAFTPTPQEIVEVMREHAGKERRPIFSFGQGCEGEPLTEAATIAKAVRLFREGGGKGTVNVNTNASLPQAVQEIAAAGASSIRVSLNSADPALYAAYYRPKGYDFNAVKQSALAAKRAGLFVSLNFLHHPGVSDTEPELAALTGFLEETRADFIQMRNLNLDPDLYLDCLRQAGTYGDGANYAPMGLRHFMKRLKKACPWISFGYFNPYLEER